MTNDSQFRIDYLNNHIRRNKDFFVDLHNINVKRDDNDTSTTTDDDGIITSLQLTNPENIFLEYLGDVEIGTPAQSIPMLFDTGSFQMWVASNLCNENCDGLLKFDSNASSTFQSTNIQAPIITYQDGTQVEGVYAYDDVSISNIKATNLQFEQITNIRQSTVLFNGIVGMGYPSSNYPTSWFESISDQLKAKEFSYYIDQTNVNGGLIFGGIDTSRLLDEPFYVENRELFISGQSIGHIYFDVVLNNLASGGSNINGFQEFLIIVDTGTSLTYLPVDITNQLHSNLSPDFSASGTADGSSIFYDIDCNKASNLGNIVFDFNGNLVSFKPTDYLFRYGPGNVCTSSIVGSDSIAAASAFTDKSGNRIKAIMGNSLLKSLYTIFDMGNNRVGFGSVNRAINVNSNLTSFSPKSNSSNGSIKSFNNYYNVYYTLLFSISTFIYIFY